MPIRAALFALCLLAGCSSVPTVQGPATSITEALTFAQQFLAYPPNLPTGQSFSTDLQVTINVAPGLYDAANENRLDYFQASR